MTIVVPATQSHVGSLLQNGVRPLDVQEWVAGTGRAVADALPRCLENPEAYLRAFLVNGECLCIWGCQDDPEVPGDGRIWLIAAARAERYVHAIHRHFKRELLAIHARWPRINAWAYGDNTLHTRWMERMGFEATHHATLGLGFRFIHYTRTQ